MDFLSSKEINLPNFEGKNILFTVLNWGIGHATRSIPLIEHLSKNNNIIIASDGEALKMLSLQFSDIEILSLPSYDVNYSEKDNFLVHIFSQIPKINKTIKKEKIQTKQIVKKYNIDIIISDNRYGCYHKKCKNYLITHQLSILTSNEILNHLSQYILNGFLKKFHEIWIPDHEKIMLSGALASRELSLPKRYLGFEKKHLSHPIREKYILFLISGPEPRRSMIISQILKLHTHIKIKKVFIQGKLNEVLKNEKSEDIEIFSAVTYNKALEYINGAELIVCRSGYSTLIDLYNLKKEKVICIPTLGQPEQEYLAEHWAEKGWVINISENDVKERLVQEIKKLL